MKPTEANYFNLVLKALFVLIQKTARLMHSSELKCKHHGKIMRHQTRRYSLINQLLFQSLN